MHEKWIVTKLLYRDASDKLPSVPKVHGIFRDIVVNLEIMLPLC